MSEWDRSDMERVEAAIDVDRIWWRGVTGAVGSIGTLVGYADESFMSDIAQFLSIPSRNNANYVSEMKGSVRVKDKGRKGKSQMEI